MPPPVQDDLLEIFQIVGWDGDMSITQGEWMAAGLPEAAFARMDKDSAGVIKLDLCMHSESSRPD